MTQMTSSYGDPTSTPVPLNLDTLITQARELRDQATADGRLYGPRNGHQVADWTGDLLAGVGWLPNDYRGVTNQVYSAFNKAGAELLAASRALDNLADLLNKIRKMSQTGKLS